jgi:hypothetical protein
MNGSIIYHGHLAQFLLNKIPFVLSVLLTAPEEYRIKTLMEEGGKSREEVKSYIKLIDERRQKWSQFLYGVNWKEPTHYDIVLNLEKINIDLAAKLLLDTASNEDFQSNEKNILALKNLHLTATANVYLQQSPRTRGSEVEIEGDSEKGSLVVSGNCPKVGARMWEKDIKTVLSKVEGVKSIKVIKSIVGYYE